MINQQHLGYQKVGDQQLNKEKEKDQAAPSKINVYNQTANYSQNNSQYNNQLENQSVSNPVINTGQYKQTPILMNQGQQNFNSLKVRPKVSTVLDLGFRNKNINERRQMRSSSKNMNGNPISFKYE